MPLSQKINHEAIIVGIFALALLTITFADCVQFMRTGTVSGVNTAWTIGIIVGTFWHARKL